MKCGDTAPHQSQEPLSFGSAYGAEFEQNAYPDMHVLSDDALVLDASPPPNGAAPANDAVGNSGVVLYLHRAHTHVEAAALLE